MHGGEPCRSDLRSRPQLPMSHGLSPQAGRYPHCPRRWASDTKDYPGAWKSLLPGINYRLFFSPWGESSSQLPLLYIFVR